MQQSARHATVGKGPRHVWERPTQALRGGASLPMSRKLPLRKLKRGHSP